MADAGVTLDLREGFEGEEVVVRAAGTADLRLEGVRTRMQTSRARSLRLPAAVEWIEVELPRRGVSARIDLGKARPWWVGVSLASDGRRLEVRQQGEAFGYV